MQILIFWRLRRGDNAMRSYFDHGPTVIWGGGGWVLKKVFHGEAPPRKRSNPLPFYLLFSTEKVPLKVPLSYTFYWQMVPLSHTVASLLWDTSIERFRSRDQHLCKFMGTKESVCIRKEINSHRTGLEHKHGRRFIVLEHPMIWPPWRHVKKRSIQGTPPFTGRKIWSRKTVHIIFVSVTSIKGTHLFREKGHSL